MQITAVNYEDILCAKIPQ